MKLKQIKSALALSTKDRVKRTVLDPLNQIVDQNITDITTTIGSFVVRSIRGKFQRSITFTIGRYYTDAWMEEALYGILYKYNNIKGASRLELKNPRDDEDGSLLHYQLDDGTHNLKYRNFDILLAIQTVQPNNVGPRTLSTRIYTIITYDLSPEFVTLFEKDMLLYRNSLLRINSDSPTISIYKDYHEGDGYTYWEKDQNILKRRLNTIYLPYETKKLIVDTINNFFASKEYYHKHGIPHNLKILMYSDPGLGKDSITKMIASEWNRNLYYITGGKNGKFISNALTDYNKSVVAPLYVISDIDKYPMIINEPDMSINDSSNQAEKVEHKQAFGAMINALDGILSGEDKIIVMTTNHIEKFSEAFLRPGRIDLLLEIPYVTAEVFRKYVYDFYGEELPDDIKLKSDKIRISEMQIDVVFAKMKYEDFVKKYVK